MDDLGPLEIWVDTTPDRALFSARVTIPTSLLKRDLLNVLAWSKIYNKSFEFTQEAYFKTVPNSLYRHGINRFKLPALPDFDLYPGGYKALLSDIKGVIHAVFPGDEAPSYSFATQWLRTREQLVQDYAMSLQIGMAERCDHSDTSFGGAQVHHYVTQVLSEYGVEFLDSFVESIEPEALEESEAVIRKHLPHLFEELGWGVSARMEDVTLTDNYGPPEIN